jgi:phytoene dehydrogenase-like protein
VLDRDLPDRDKHGALRGMLSLLADNPPYRGPAMPGTAAAFAYGFAVPDQNALLVKKLRGGIGALTAHLEQLLTANGGDVRLRSKVEEILVADGRAAGVRLEDGSTVDAPVVVSAIAPDLTIRKLLDPSTLPADIRQRFSRVDHRGSYLQMHFALDGVPSFAGPYTMLNDPEMQSNIGIFSTPEELQQQWEDCRRGVVPADPSIALQIPSVNDPGLAPAGKHAASAFSLWFPIEQAQTGYGEMKAQMGRRVIEKISRLAPNFEDLIIRHTTFTPKHMGTMFGAPDGDYCHGLIHPDQIGINRPGPRGYVDQPIPIDGLYLASAGCHGGPGITFVPGYNAAKQVLADAT